MEAHTQEKKAVNFKKIRRIQESCNNILEKRLKELKNDCQSSEYKLKEIELESNRKTLQIIDSLKDLNPILKKVKSTELLLERPFYSLNDTDINIKPKRLTTSLSKNYKEKLNHIIERLNSLKEESNIDTCVSQSEMKFTKINNNHSFITVKTDKLFFNRKKNKEMESIYVGYRTVIVIAIILCYLFTT